MNKVEIILFVTTTISIVTALGCYIKYKRLENKQAFELHKCKYNENPECYEMACGYCDKIKECNICCGCDCNMCPGHKVEYFYPDRIRYDADERI